MAAVHLPAIGLALLALGGCARFVSLSGDGTVGAGDGSGARDTASGKDAARELRPDHALDRLQLGDMLGADARPDLPRPDLFRPDLFRADLRGPDLFKPDLPKPDLGCDDGDVCTVDSLSGSGCQHSSYELGPCLDQAQASPINMQADVSYIAQTFTAGKTGKLAGVNVHVAGYTGLTYPLRVTIRDTTTTGEPGQLLDGTTLSTPGVLLSQLITFPQSVSIVAGKLYAIVVDYPSAPPPSHFGGSWFGGTGNVYGAGQAWKSTDGLTWSVLMVGADQRFRVYVRP